MKHQLLSSHVQDEKLGRSMLFSLLGHGLLLIVLLAAGYLLPQGLIIDLRSDQGGGQGDRIIPVQLATELEDGGFGTVRPTLAPTPRSVPPEPEEKPETPTPKPVEREEFVEKTPPKKPQEKRPQLPEDRPPINPPEPPKPEPGDIVREPDPGTGGSGSVGGGSGGGMGSGVGLEVGQGHGGGQGISSYYVRLVEQRVGSNWLKTSLGELGRPVETVILFTVERNGRISDIEMVRDSGIRTVDVAAERAVRASNPLPPLPAEFRGRSVRFRSVFRYPPR
ncbi:MAG TPA: energy transducer TonB [Acidobacteriota bacterium]|nr:energy transducer TonB [Acidobacteriota bacterium]